METTTPEKKTIPIMELRQLLGTTPAGGLTNLAFLMPGNVEVSMRLTVGHTELFLTLDTVVYGHRLQLTCEPSVGEILAIKEEGLI